LPQLVNEVLGDQKIDSILVNVGPGSFTGIRVGIAFAKGLAMGRGLPLKGMNSFIATYESLESQEDVLILIEAHRRDVFAQLFQKRVPQTPQSLTREDIEQILESPSPPLLAGSGVHPFLEGLSFKKIASKWQGAQSLAYAFFKNESFAVDSSPVYVRDADVSFPSPK
jgi:tRNA threonylcarbamoyladenosine biosynthesis protein TsaB